MSNQQSPQEVARRLLKEANLFAEIGENVFATPEDLRTLCNAVLAISDLPGQILRLRITTVYASDRAFNSGVDAAWSKAMQYCNTPPTTTHAAEPQEQSK